MDLVQLERRQTEYIQRRASTASIASTVLSHQERGNTDTKKTGNPIENVDEKDSVARTTTPRQQPAKRKNHNIDITTSTTATTTTASHRSGKRVTRESDILRQGNPKDDDDVIVSAVVESKQHHRRDRRRSTPSTSTRTSSTILPRDATAVEEDAEDDVVLEAVANEMKLPHNRADCPECTFVNTPTYGPYNGINDLDPNNDNWMNCDMCYCYVCDKPTRDCYYWVSPASRSVDDNHCCAKPNTEPWKSMRDAKKKIVY